MAKQEKRAKRRQKFLYLTNVFEVGLCQKNRIYLGFKNVTLRMSRFFWAIPPLRQFTTLPKKFDIFTNVSPAFHIAEATWVFSFISVKKILDFTNPLQFIYAMTKKLQLGSKLLLPQGNHCSNSISHSRVKDWNIILQEWKGENWSCGYSNIGSNSDRSRI